MADLARLAAGPIFTEPNPTHSEWAGSTLQRLLRSPQPIAETWAFFSGPDRAARIAGAGGLTMADLVQRCPEVLGPAGQDPKNNGQKYFFVKFLDPSDFPRFAYVGFRPETAGALGPEALRRQVAALLAQDREALEQLAACVRPRIATQAAFAKFQAAYKAWAIAHAAAEWEATRAPELAGFAERPADAARALESQRQVRRQLAQLIHRIEFEPGRAILIETPTLHAIAGLSLQIHPNTPEHFHPKDELWLYEPLPSPGHADGWILVEPQRTFDRTESGGDFFTPFAWEGVGSTGRLGFRKQITPEYLRKFVALMDATPHPREHFLRRTAQMAVPQSRLEGQVGWWRVVEEPAWPHFIVRLLRFDGPGEASVPQRRDSFVEVHPTQGVVELVLSGGGQRERRERLTPARPVFLPASLPYETVRFRASAPARAYWFSRG